MAISRHPSGSIFVLRSVESTRAPNPERVPAALRWPWGPARCPPRGSERRSRAGPRCSEAEAFSTGTAGTDSQAGTAVAAEPPCPFVRYRRLQDRRRHRGLGVVCRPDAGHSGSIRALEKRDQPACESAIFLKSLFSVARYQPGQAQLDLTLPRPPVVTGAPAGAVRRAMMGDSRVNPSSKVISALISRRHAYSV